MLRPIRLSNQPVTGSFQELQQPRHEDGHSSLSSTDDKNEWNCTSATVCPRSMNRERLSFIFVRNNVNWQNFVIFWEFPVLKLVRQTGYTSKYFEDFFNSSNHFLVSNLKMGHQRFLPSALSFIFPSHSTTGQHKLLDKKRSLLQNTPPK